MMSGLRVGADVTTEYGVGHVVDLTTRRVLIRLHDEAPPWDMLNVVTGTPGYERIKVHAGYPHEPGRLYDCPACDSYCHCTPGTVECVYEGRHKPVNQPGTEQAP